MKRIIYYMVVGLLFVSGTVWADTLELTNGKKIEGTFVGRSDGSVKFEVDGITTTYDEKDVINIPANTLLEVPLAEPFTS